jgi:hypothetical protein
MISTFLDIRISILAPDREEWPYDDRRRSAIWWDRLAAVRTLILAALLVASPLQVGAQARLQAGDSVQFQVEGGAPRQGRVVSVGSEALTVLEGSAQNRYMLSEIDELRLGRPIDGAGESAFWKGALIGGVLGGGAGLVVGLTNVSDWANPDPREPSEAQIVAAVTVGGAMLGGLTFGIIGALLASDHEWVDVGPSRQQPGSSVELGFRISR